MRDETYQSQCRDYDRLIPETSYWPHCGPVHFGKANKWNFYGFSVPSALSSAYH